MSLDRTPELRAQVLAARAAGTRLAVRGGYSRAAWIGYGASSDVLDVADHQGITAYVPTELVVTARAGTTLAAIDAELAEAGQMLASEPPRPGPDSTLGGALAHGWSGPRRPWGGSVRDQVLGVQLLNGHGEVLRFGGQVIKNVAGYDLSRLQVGAQGAYGVILEASLKVLPRPEVEVSFAISAPADAALAEMARWLGRGGAVSGLAWDAGRLFLRFSGAAAAVDESLEHLGGAEVVTGEVWRRLRDLDPVSCCAASDSGGTLWRVQVPMGSGHMDLPGTWTIDQGGMVRWLRTEADAEEIHAVVLRYGGRAEPVGCPVGRDSGRDPLRARLYAAFDPDGVFRGCDAD